MKITETKIYLGDRASNNFYFPPPNTRFYCGAEGV